MKTLKERTQHAIDEGFTIGELAAAAGKSSSAVSQWKSGKSKDLKADSAVGLEALTGWSATWWATGKGDRGQTRRRPRAEESPAAYVVNPSGHSPMSSSGDAADASEMVSEDQRARLLRAFSKLLDDDQARVLAQLEAEAAVIEALEERLRRERPPSPGPVDPKIAAFDRPERRKRTGGSALDREVMIRPGDPRRRGDVGNVG